MSLTPVADTLLVLVGKSATVTRGTAGRGGRRSKCRRGVESWRMVGRGKPGHGSCFCFCFVGVVSPRVTVEHVEHQSWMRFAGNDDQCGVYLKGREREGGGGRGGSVVGAEFTFSGGIFEGHSRKRGEDCGGFRRPEAVAERGDDGGHRRRLALLFPRNICR